MSEDTRNPDPADSKPRRDKRATIAKATLGRGSSFTASIALGKLVVFDGSRRTVYDFDRNMPLTVTVQQ